MSNPSSARNTAIHQRPKLKPQRDEQATEAQRKQELSRLATSLLSGPNAELFHRYEVEEGKAQHLKAKARLQEQQMVNINIDLQKIAEDHTEQVTQHYSMMNDAQLKFNELEEEETKLDAQIEEALRQIETLAAGVSSVKLQLAHNFQIHGALSGGRDIEGLEAGDMDGLHDGEEDYWEEDGALTTDSEEEEESTPTARGSSATTSPTQEDDDTTTLKIDGGGATPSVHTSSAPTGAVTPHTSGGNSPPFAEPGSHGISPKSADETVGRNLIAEIGGEFPDEIQRRRLKARQREKRRRARAVDRRAALIVIHQAKQALIQEVQAVEILHRDGRLMQHEADKRRLEILEKAEAAQDLLQSVKTKKMSGTAAMACVPAASPDDLQRCREMVKELHQDIDEHCNVVDKEQFANEQEWLSALEEFDKQQFQESRREKNKPDGYEKKRRGSRSSSRSPQPHSFITNKDESGPSSALIIREASKRAKPLLEREPSETNRHDGVEVDTSLCHKSHHKTLVASDALSSMQCKSAHKSRYMKAAMNILSHPESKSVAVSTTDGAGGAPRAPSMPLPAPPPTTAAVGTRPATAGARYRFKTHAMLERVATATTNMTPNQRKVQLVHGPVGELNNK